MKKMRTILTFALVAILSISMCACSALTNLASNTVYNKGSLEKGYTNVSSVDGVKFCVPSDMKEEALGEMEFLAYSLSAMEDSEAKSKLLKSTFELKDSGTYALMNYSKGIFAVSRTELDKKLADIDDQKELFKAMDAEDNVDGFKVGDSYLKATVDGVTKMICPMSMTVDAELYETAKDIDFEGHLAVIENKDGDVYMMIAVFVDGTKDADSMSKYIAKSLEYTGEKLAEIDDWDDDDWDDDGWEWSYGDDDDDWDDDDWAWGGDNDDDDDDTNGGSTVSTEKFDAGLYDFKLMIDGKTITIPMKVSDLMDKLNLKMDASDAEMTMKKNQYGLIVLKNGDKKLYVKALNADSDTPLATKDCYAFSIYADKYDIYGYGSNLKANISIVLPGNIVVAKSTYEDVLAAYGEPDTTSNGDESSFIYLKYTLTDDTHDYYTKMEITIEKESNRVYKFEYCKMPG